MKTEHINRICLECGNMFTTRLPTRYFCSKECRHSHEQKDPIFRKNAECIKFNEEHNTNYSYGEYMALKRTRRLDTIAEKPKNVHTPYWVHVPEKVVI